MQICQFFPNKWNSLKKSCTTASAFANKLEIGKRNKSIYESFIVELLYVVVRAIRQLYVKIQRNKEQSDRCLSRSLCVWSNPEQSINLTYSRSMVACRAPHNHLIDRHTIHKNIGCVYTDVSRRSRMRWKRNGNNRRFHAHTQHGNRWQVDCSVIVVIHYMCVGGSIFE